MDRSHGSPRRLVHELTKRGVDPFPSRSGVSRLLKRPDLIDPNARRKRHETFGRVLRSFKVCGLHRGDGARNWGV